MRMKLGETKKERERERECEIRRENFLKSKEVIKRESNNMKME